MCLKPAADGVRLAVRVTPRASSERLNGVADDRLKVAVTAPPVENQANEAVLRLLAREFRLPRRELSIVGGSKTRNKVIHIAGSASELMTRLAQLLK